MRLRSALPFPALGAPTGPLPPERADAPIRAWSGHAHPPPDPRARPPSPHPPGTEPTPRHQHRRPATTPGLAHHHTRRRPATVLAGRSRPDRLCRHHFGDHVGQRLDWRWAGLLWQRQYDVDGTVHADPCCCRCACRRAETIGRRSPPEWANRRRIRRVDPSRSMMTGSVDVGSRQAAAPPAPVASLRRA